LANAQLSLGYAYLKGEGVSRDDAQAAKWLTLAATKGLADAQNALGLMYLNGAGVPRDPAKGVKWIRLAAEQGLGTAQANLGAQYHMGESVPRDDTEAMKWSRRAAEQGLAVAQNRLGFMYRNGAGVPRDIVEAVKWYRQAAAQGLAIAQNNLGTAYYSGDGVPRDYVEAYMWFSLAAAQGEAEAHKNLDQTEALLSPAQRGKAQEMAREWKPSQNTVTAATWSFPRPHNNDDAQPLAILKGTTATHTLSYRAGAGGQITLTAMVNGAPIRFVVDTGASHVTLTPEDARAAGIGISELSFNRRSNTANGTVLVAPVNLREIRIEQLSVENVPAAVNKNLAGVSLLGMSFLNRLKGFQMRDGALTINW
jgi:clan AA aspartic protease (TIGR02281 family)